MKQMIIPVDDKALYIYPAKDSTILDCQIEHLKRVRKWLFQTPFATLATALKSGTEKDQLRCMHQAERWLLKCHPAEIFGRYTRVQFLEDVQRLIHILGGVVSPTVLRKYQNTWPRKRMTMDEKEIF